MYCEIPQNWKRNRVYSMCAMARCLPLGHLLPHFVVTVKIDSNKSSSLPSLQTKIIWVKHHALQESDTTLDDLINQCPHINTYILDRTVRILLMNENSLRNNSTVYPLCPKKRSLMISSELLFKLVLGEGEGKRKIMYSFCICLDYF